MHDGNLSFRPGTLGGRAAFRLAPAYDMLPMLYAPARGVELPPREFRPRLPLPAERELWDPASRAAVGFWQTAAEDARISATFRATCAANAKGLARML